MFWLRLLLESVTGFPSAEVRGILGKTASLEGEVCNAETIYGYCTLLTIVEPMTRLHLTLCEYPISFATLRPRYRNEKLF